MASAAPDTEGVSLSPPTEQMAALKTSSQDDDVPPNRSHDAVKNLKRSDPFQFGSRFLGEGDDAFEFNAWDHVETDEAYKEYAESQFEMQRQAPVSDFDKSLSCLMRPVTDTAKDRFNSDPAKWWNLFYKNNASNFFKNRKWLQQEFPVLAEVTEAGAGPKVVLEIGAGAGNTAFPVLANNKNPHLKIHACDFSKTAVEVVRNHEAYDPKYMQADAWDASADCLPPDVKKGSVDVAVMVFIFSALAPKEWSQAVRNVHRMLKPGGVVCFRDYGRGDLTQVRFRKGRYLEENFYIRGDGTRVYFFDCQELAGIWTGEGSTDSEGTETPKFRVEKLGADRRLLVNRAQKIKMYRCWLQGSFRKQ